MEGKGGGGRIERWKVKKARVVKMTVGLGLLREVRGKGPGSFGEGKAWKGTPRSRFMQKRGIPVASGTGGDAGGLGSAAGKRG